MTRPIIAALALALVTAVGCSETGNEERCRQAIRNIFHITGLDKTGSGPDEHAAIRSCRANASDQAITCMIAAKNTEDLAKCDKIDLGAQQADKGAEEPKQGE